MYLMITELVNDEKGFLVKLIRANDSAEFEWRPDMEYQKNTLNEFKVKSFVSASDEELKQTKLGVFEKLKVKK